MQGLAFILLVSALVHQEVSEALEALKVKAAKRHGVWMACNCKKRRVELFEKLNTPLEVLPKC